jgi:hypothetical protein
VGRGSQYREMVFRREMWRQEPDGGQMQVTARETSQYGREAPRRSCRLYPIVCRVLREMESLRT